MTAPFNEFGPFAVGEIVYVVKSERHPELVGAETIITSGLEWTHHKNGFSGWTHGTKLRGKNGFLRAVPENLRRRKPPQADTNERMYVQMWRDMAGKAPQKVGVPC